VTLFAAVLVASGPARAAPPAPKLTFRPTTLSFNWEKLEKTVPVEVRNETPQLVHLIFFVTAFHNADASYSKRLAIAKPATATVEPGDSVDVRVIVGSPQTSKSNSAKVSAAAHGNAQPPTKPKTTGSYDGSLVAYDSAKKVFARLPLTLTVAADTKTQEKVVPEPLVDAKTKTVEHCGWIPFHCRSRPSDGEIQLELKQMVKPGEELALTKKTRLGVIKNDDDDVVIVYWDGKPPKMVTSDSSAIGLRFSDGFGGSGKYSGKLDLLPDDKEKKGEIALTVNFNDALWWPTIVIALGVISGFLVARRVGVSIPYSRLRRQIRSRRAEYDRSQRAFRRAAADTRWVDYDIAPAVVHEIEDALVAAATKLRGSYLGKIPADEVSDLTKKIDSEFDKVMLLDGFRRDLTDLDAKVADLENIEPLALAGFDLKPPPKAATTLAELLRGRRYDDLARLTARQTEIQAAPASADEWRALEASLRASQDDILRYGSENGNLKPNFVPLEESLRTLYLQLWHNVDAKNAKTVLADLANKLAADVAAARADLPDLAAVGAEIPVRPPAEPQPPRKPRGFGARAGRGTAFGYGGSGLSAVALLSALWNWLGSVLSALWGSLVRMLRAALRMFWHAVRTLDSAVDGSIGWDALSLLIVAIVVAVASGLSTEYAGKVIGGPWDYLKLFLWGFGTKVLFDGIVGGLDAIGVLRDVRR